MGDSEITLQGVSKIYNPGLFKKKVQAVMDLSLEVNKGEVYGLIGPNGAGKSTTIRVLLGLIRPDKGEILFRGERLRSCDFRYKVGYLPENPYLYDHLNLVEVLQFCGRISGCSGVFLRERIGSLAEKLGLTDALRRPIRTYSKGMLQRAGVCFALLHDPSIVVLDEPMSGLDPLGRKLVFDIVQELKGQGKTVFFCSHILSDVERLCDRMGILVRGQLVRNFDRKDFVVNVETKVNLLVSPLSDWLVMQLPDFAELLHNSCEGALISVPSSRIGDVMTVFGEIGVEIVGSRDSQVSLEDVFIQTVEGVLS